MTTGGRNRRRPEQASLGFRRQFRPRAEQLESRLLLSATYPNLQNYAVPVDNPTLPAGMDTFTPPVDGQIPSSSAGPGGHDPNRQRQRRAGPHRRSILQLHGRRFGQGLAVPRLQPDHGRQWDVFHRQHPPGKQFPGVRGVAGGPAGQCDLFRLGPKQRRHELSPGGEPDAGLVGRPKHLRGRAEHQRLRAEPGLLPQHLYRNQRVLDLHRAQRRRRAMGHAHRGQPLQGDLHDPGRAGQRHVPGVGRQRPRRRVRLERQRQHHRAERRHLDRPDHQRHELRGDGQRHDGRHRGDQQRHEGSGRGRPDLLPARDLLLQRS